MDGDSMLACLYLLATADTKQSKSSPPHNKQEKMSSTTDIEMAYCPDGPDASYYHSSCSSASPPLPPRTSSDLLKTTNGDLLKMLMEMKKENKKMVTQVMTAVKNEVGSSHKKLKDMLVICFLFPNLLIFIITIMVAENNRGLYIDGSFRCGNQTT